MSAGAIRLKFLTRDDTDRTLTAVLRWAAQVIEAGGVAPVITEHDGIIDIVCDDARACLNEMIDAGVVDVAFTDYEVDA